MDLPELDERKASILRAIVEEYVETAQPVGSQTVARSSCLGVSSATIRNDMTVLAREGFIVHPDRSHGVGAGGVHRPAPHVGRAGPHRPRLPLLRRPLHRPGPAAGVAAP